MYKNLILGLIVIVAMSCQHDAVIPEEYQTASQSEFCDSDTVYFVNDIQPLLNSTCATSGCHDDQTAKHGVKITSYINIIQTAKVRPYRPDDSKLYEVLFGGKDGDLMPPSPQSPLTDAQKQMIYKWIEQGAKNNECLECDTENLGFAADINSIITNNCLSCHSGTAPEAGVLLTNYSEIAAIAQTGLLMNAITGNGVTKMPLGSSLSTCNIAKIEKWINDGYPNN